MYIRENDGKQRAGVGSSQEDSKTNKSGNFLLLAPLCVLGTERTKEREIVPITVFFAS